MKVNKWCSECGKSIQPKRIRCRKCYIEFYRGENHPNWRNGRDKIKNNCTVCKKEFITAKRYIDKGQGRFCSSQCYGETLKDKPSLNRGRKYPSISGKNHHHWKGGIGKKPYPFEFNAELKEEIRRRDKYICQKCNITEEEHLIVYGKVLGVHHIDYDKENIKEENLITLCNECNIRVNYNRDYWTNYFQKEMVKDNKTI